MEREGDGEGGREGRGMGGGGGGGSKGGKVDIYYSTNRTQVVVSRPFAQVGRVWEHAYVQVVYR